MIRRQARTTFRPEVLTDLGLFSGAIAVPSGYSQPVLVASTDGVGTKVKIATALDKHDTIGIDLVNLSVNDIFTRGADPLLFLDYIGMGKLVPSVVEDLVRGMALACREVRCALIGGETAEMPGFYAEGEYDLVGFVVGVVARKKIRARSLSRGVPVLREQAPLPKLEQAAKRPVLATQISAIEPGDPVIGIPSSGLHTNGYSLARKAFGLVKCPRSEARRRLETYYPELGRTLGEELLEPHRCYYHPLKDHLSKIKAMAHITGGGLVGNIPRSLRPGVGVRLDRHAWKSLPIFGLIQRMGHVPQQEMYRVYNMGIGYTVICAPEDANELVRAIDGAIIIGEVVAGDRQVVIEC